MTQILSEREIELLQSQRAHLSEEDRRAKARAKRKWRSYRLRNRLGVFAG